MEIYCAKYQLIFVTFLYKRSGFVSMLDLVDFELNVDPRIWIQIQIKLENSEG